MKILNQPFVPAEITAHHQSSTLAHPILHSMVDAAAALLREQGLPHSGDEDYKRFDITTLLEGTYTRSQHEITPAEEQRLLTRQCSLTSVSHAYGAMVEDHGVTENSVEGLYWGLLSTFVEEHPEVAQRYIGQMESLRTDSLTALNTLMAEDALVLYAAPGVQVQDTVHLVHMGDRTDYGHPIWSSPRLIVIADEGASLRLLDCDHTRHIGHAVRNMVVEIYAAPHSHIEYYDVEESGATATRLHTLHTALEADSSVHLYALTIQNGRTRNNYFGDLRGAHARLYLNGISILDGEQSAENRSVIRHSVPDCHSDELFKYTLNDTATGSFSGLIYVAQDAQRTTAYQNNRNLLLSPKARMYSKPHLEIYADDVKCSHGMTTGELDSAALFYMQQRGIPYVEAKLLLTIAFMSEVLERIHFVDLRDRLIDVIETRYRGLPGFCHRQ